MNKRYTTLHIGGMHCKSCEMQLEAALRKVPGVLEAQAHFAKGTVQIAADADHLPSASAVSAAVEHAGYVIGSPMPAAHAVQASGRQQLWLELAGYFLIIFLLWNLASALDLASFAPSVNAVASASGALLIGLLAGTSSCLAVTGGLLLSVTGNQRKKGVSAFWPSLGFNFGRVVSYALFGGLIGLAGQSLSISPAVSGFLSLAVAFIMLTLGLRMTELLPQAICNYRTSKRIINTMERLTGSGHVLAPALLGAATFFLPCGFTQSLQIAALGSGGFLPGALMMGAFAVGTLPMLLSVGALSAFLTGKAGKMFFRFSGALLLVLGALNADSGLTLLGLDPANLLPHRSEIMALVPMAEGKQEIHMTVTPGGYSPSTFTVKAGKPVHWVVNGNGAQGCTSVLVVPSLNITKPLQPGDNVIEFTPTTPGQVAFSCSMGMVKGSFTVVL